jgi:hypothetical protein
VQQEIVMGELAALGFASRSVGVVPGEPDRVSGAAGLQVELDLSRARSR